LETLLASEDEQAGAFSVISFQRAAVFVTLGHHYRKKVIDRELRPFCTSCESFSSTRLVSRKNEREQRRHSY